MEIVHLDFETYYEVGKFSLSSLSTQQYILDDRFETIGAAIQWPDDKVPHWHIGADLERQLDVLRDWQGDIILTAQNSAFDASILAWRYHIHPAEQACTISMARSCGLGLVSSLGLEALAQLARAAGHDVPLKGHEVVLASGKRLKDFSASELRDYGRYCVDDVRILKGVFDALIKYLPPEEMLFQSSILKCFTERPFVLNRDVVLEEQQRVADKRATAVAKLCAALGVPDEALLKSVVSSNQKFAEALSLFGAEPPMKRSKTTGKPTFAFGKTDPAFLDMLNHDTPEVAALVEARLDLKSSIEETRCRAFLGLEALGPLPVPLQVSGAHTHRLSGGGGGGKGAAALSWNPQNLPSGRKPGQSKALKVALEMPPGVVLSGGDSSQVEVRVLDYCAGDWQALQDFAAGVCPYSKFAAMFWPTPGITAADVKKLAKGGDELWGSRRQLSKVIILASGYGIGPPAFRDYAKAQAGMVLTYPEAKVYNRGYKDMKPLVPKFWSTCDRVLKALARGEGVEFGGLDGKLFTADPQHKVMGITMPGIMLPDGMWLHYPDLEMVEVEELVDVRDDETGEVTHQELQNRTKARFWTKKGKANVPNFTWGGTIVENICQAFAFSAMKYQAGLLRYPLVLNEHDANYIKSSVDDAADALANLREAMSTTPPWAPGLPLQCEAGQSYCLGKLEKR